MTAFVSRFVIFRITFTRATFVLFFIIFLTIRTITVRPAIPGRAGGALQSKIRQPIAIDITARGIAPMALLDGPARRIGIGLDERCDLGEVIGHFHGLAGTGGRDTDPGSGIDDRVGSLAGRAFGACG